jgi:hypothetical protein
MTGGITPQPRFDGATAWVSLTPEQQAFIGAIALEFVVNMHGEDAYFTGLEAKPEARPFIAGAPLLSDMLMTAVDDAIRDSVPALHDDELPIPIPSSLGPVCRVCRCSEEDACDGGCGWAEPDLCTACVVEAKHATQA